MDLVSYNDKHNEANQEDNRDGHSHNLSWNCGAEGETDDPEVIALRDRQRRNLMATLLLSQGTPMILMGDEMGRTQGGNNNAYCQDNEINWMDWTPDARSAAFETFVRGLIAIRKDRDLMLADRFLHAGPDPRGSRYARWLKRRGRRDGRTATGTGTNEMRCIGLLLHEAGDALLLLMNAGHEDCLPPARRPGPRWRRLVDTAEGYSDPGPTRLLGRAGRPARARAPPARDAVPCLTACPTGAPSAWPTGACASASGHPTAGG
jgi:isoamylase